MKEDEIKLTWQYAELKKHFKKNSKEKLIDSQSLYQANPSEKDKIDNILRNHLWPGVLKGVGTSGIWIKALEGTFPQSGIEDKKANHTIRTLTYLLEDPKRQISYESNVPLYCRGEI